MNVHCLSWLFCWLAIAGLAWADPAADDLKAMQGGWRLIYAQKSNKELSPAELKALHVVITDAKFVIYHEGKIVETAELTLEPALSPKGFRLKALDKDGTQSLGIYKFESGVLHLCWEKHGEQRPLVFDGQHPDGNVAYMRLQK